MYVPVTQLDPRAAGRENARARRNADWHADAPFARNAGAGFDSTWRAHPARPPAHASRVPRRGRRRCASTCSSFGAATVCVCHQMSPLPARRSTVTSWRVHSVPSRSEAAVTATRLCVCGRCVVAVGSAQWLTIGWVLVTTPLHAQVLPTDAPSLVGMSEARANYAYRGGVRFPSSSNPFPGLPAPLTTRVPATVTLPQARAVPSNVAKGETYEWNQGPMAGQSAAKDAYVGQRARATRPLVALTCTCP